MENRGRCVCDPAPRDDECERACRSRRRNASCVSLEHRCWFVDRRMSTFNYIKRDKLLATLQYAAMFAGD
jgi:hypothetical protein